MESWNGKRTLVKEKQGDLNKLWTSVYDISTLVH